MFSLFNILNSCCSKEAFHDSYQIELDCEQRPKDLEEMASMLNDKLGFIIIYTDQNELIAINEALKDKDFDMIFNEKFTQIYINKERKIAEDFLSAINYQHKSFKIVAMIVKVVNNKIDSTSVIDSITDDEITNDKVKVFIYANQYKLIRLSSEPMENDPNTALICFVSPNRTKMFERGFKKQQKVSELYKFVTTKINDIFGISSKKDFLLAIYPSKVLSNKEMSIEQEKLFPRAVIQIREI